MEDQVALRDTTFDNVVPERLWIGVTNMKGDGKLHVVAEINGIEKVIWSGIPAHADPKECSIYDFSNLTWVLKKLTPPAGPGKPESE